MHFEHFWSMLIGTRRDLKVRNVVDLEHFWCMFIGTRRDFKVQKMSLYLAAV